MAALDVTDKVMLGRYIVMASHTPAERAKLLNPLTAKAQLEQNGVKTLPKDDAVIFHADEKNVTHLILPQPEDIQAAVDMANSNHFPYLNDYKPQPLADPALNNDFLLALYFRIGEYIVGRCKG